MSSLLSLDDFRAEARKDAGFHHPVMRLATDPAIDVEGEARTLRFCFSDGTTDRSGDRIDPRGWQLDDFNKNPVALWAHSSWDPPIGRAKNVAVIGKRLMGDIEFADADTYAFADTIFRLVKGKFVNAVSVGFMPVEWSFSADKERPFGIDFDKQDLLEISPCPVPCNPNALSEARAKGIDTRPLMQWAERVLDEGNAVVVPRATLEQIFKDARTPHSARAKYRAMIERKEMPDWTCSAARDLPIDSHSSWDGAAAEKSIFDACGFDGDSPDTARAAKHFLIHDASAPTLKGSYGFPFAQIVDGKSEAVAAGLHACASRLPDSHYPQAAKDAMQAVIDHYKTKMGDKAWKAAGENTGAGGGALVPAMGNCGRSKTEDCGMKDAQQCAVHAQFGNCGRAADETCGMKDPSECAVHRAASKALKAGRRISAANKAKLQEALDHHEECAKCIRAVMGSDDGDPADGADAAAPPPGPEAQQIEDDLDPAAKRLREARALKASLAQA